MNLITDLYLVIRDLNGSLKALLKIQKYAAKCWKILDTFTQICLTMNFDALKPIVEEIISQNETAVDERLLQICKLLKAQVEHYDWVGFYFRNGQKEELKLGPYVGEPTDHTIIPFGKGICGQVAVSNQNFVVPDVMAQDNYIACSISVKSEIVIPIFVDGENIGQIDIDSKTSDPFTPEDEHFLEFICAKVGHIL